MKVLRLNRLASSLESASSNPTLKSLLPKSHFSLPSLHWGEREKAPTHHKQPLLMLTLSSHSFLDSSLEDHSSATPIYTIETIDASTTVVRCDGEDGFIKIANIKWPSATKEAGEDDNNRPSIKMTGRRHIYSRSSRKFSIPGFSHSMKWKRYGTLYWCTTSSVKGPIAILDLAKGPEPTKLAIFETLYDKYDPQEILVYKGVSLLLLDYLVVTALLSATDVDAWSLLDKIDDITDIAANRSADSDSQELHYVPEFPFRPYYMVSKELPRTPREVSLASLATTTTVPISLSNVPRSVGSYGIEMPTWVGSGASSSKRDSGAYASSVEDWSENYRVFLRGFKAASSPEFMQHGSIPASAKISIHSSQDVASPSQSSQAPTVPRASTPSSHCDIPHPVDELHRMSIHSPPPSPLGPERRESSHLSQQPPNVSDPVDSVKRDESQRRPLPRPPAEAGIRHMRGSSQLAVKSELSKEGHTREIRSLPPTPVIGSASPRIENRAPATGYGVLQVHSRAPPMTKISQEDIAQWVHTLTNAERALPPAPLPQTSVFDMPPPSYNSIYFSKRVTRSCTPVSTTLST